MNRRSFLQGTSAAAGWAITSSLAAEENTSANDRITVCVMGVRGRGGNLLGTFASQKDVHVKYVCDLDPIVLRSRTAQVEAKTGHKPIAIKDYREALDDKSVDALVCGCPDHWHALPTIHACQAGKDVYVEKPDGHNILEGRTMVAAAKKHSRIIQLGTQARSGTMQGAAMKYIADGNLGKVRFAKAWESARQGSLGNPPDSDPPKGFDYDTWLGPAPKRPFNIRRWHGNWRWFFDYGTGDLGNDGVHRLDVARWGLSTAIEAEGRKAPVFPQAISAHGGKHYFDDCQEWPDNLMVIYDYPGGYLLTYEMRIWSPYKLHGESEGACICGDEGYVTIGNRRWRAFDRRGELIKEEPGGDNTVGHVRNFLECMRNRKKPNADLETVGHPSSLLCHLGNAAWRAGRTLRFDPMSYKFQDKDADQYLTRAEYRKPWVLPSIDEV
ncbi:MAG: Gfo/Idh/MocA family oxidoreductase [Planctomycetes bacterium]|nr:Gfo/Idh/MocA family oxidoreductase [Planctomycetota bacterium]